MSDWKAKRFWKDASVLPIESGFSVALDGRPVRTPSKAHLILPTRAMAEAVAAEWQAQEGLIKPLTMPVTRSANSAIDKVATQHAEVAAMLASYGETDLLCYRAGAPSALEIRQSEGWDPVLTWARDTLGAPLAVTEGVVPIPQPAESLERLATVVRSFEPFSMTALHDLVTLSGSLVLGLYVAQGGGSADQAWALSRIDEEWQAEQWGDDDEALEAAAIKRAAYLHAARFLELSENA